MAFAPAGTSYSLVVGRDASLHSAEGSGGPSPPLKGSLSLVPTSTLWVYVTSPITAEVGNRHHLLHPTLSYTVHPIQRGGL